MKKLSCLLPALAISIAWPQPGYAVKAPLHLEPSSKWVMRHQDDSCRLVRLFGKDDNQMMVVFTRFGLGHAFRITLAGNPVSTVNDKRPLKVQFGANLPEQRINYVIGKSGGLPALIATQRVRISGFGTKAKPRPIKQHQYAGAEFMNIRVGQKTPVRLATGSLAEPFKAMNKCVRELVTGWGVDMEKLKSMTRRVKPVSSPGNWLRPKDYPINMLRQRQPGIVNFRMSVDDKGRATGCHIQQTTRPKEFDDAVCETLMKRASFKPALDAESKPMASFWRGTVRFAIRN